jgi:hypothetical protein
MESDGKTSPDDLAAVVQATAQKLGLDVGQVHAGPGHEAEMMSDRGLVVVSPRREGGPFYVAISGKENNWASGEAADLRDVVGVAALWRLGCTLRELGSRFPFMVYTPLAEAYEVGGPVEFRWNALLADAELSSVRPLLLAAHENGRLRKLLPTVTHLTLLRLEIDYRDPDCGVILIQKDSDVHYQVCFVAAIEDAEIGPWAHVNSIDDAIATAGELMP